MNLADKSLSGSDNCSHIGHPPEECDFDDINEVCKKQYFDQSIFKNMKERPFLEKFNIPPLQFVDIEERQFYFPQDHEKGMKQLDLKDKNLYYGAFYAKLVTTCNKIRQYNSMVFGEPNFK